jgi:hypothetical protein
MGHGHGQGREDRGRKMDQMTGLGRSQGRVVQEVVAIASDHSGDQNWKDTRHPNHCRETLVIVVFGLEGRTTGVLACVAGLGDGPKRSVNRGADDCGAKYLVERLNQTVSIHADMANAPTRRSPGTHARKAQKHVHQTNPRRRKNPNRGGLNQSRY